MSSGQIVGFRSSLGQLYGMIQPRLRRELWVVALLTVAGAFAEVAAIGAVVPFLALLANNSNGAEPALMTAFFDGLGATSAREQLLWATALLCLAAVGAALLRIILIRKTQYFANLFGHELALEVQRRMLFQPYIWHTGRNSSRHLATIDKVQIVSSQVLLPLIRACAAAVLIAAVAVALVQLAPVATVIAGVTLGTAYYAFGIASRRRLFRNSDIVDSALERRMRIIQEASGGIREVILDGSQERVLSSFRAADLQLARALVNSAVLSSIPRYLLEAAGIVVIAGLALLLSAREGGLVAALPILGALALGAQRLLPLVQQLFQGWSSIAANRSVIAEVARPLQMPLPSEAPRRPGLPFSRSIEFRNVGFSFPGRGDRAVTGLTFDIAKGARVALVGRTGSGKSTTADLLMGLLVPDEGEILIDGAPLSDENRESWRASVAHVPQTPFLADATIAENIALSADPDPRLIREAASLAQLDAFVEALPDGYSTSIGERGARLSGGQRQRLAIARAIYKQAPVLVLDEATSALDDQTEAAIATALDELQARGRTIVIIAHRSAITRTCEILLKLEKGRIVEKLVR